MTDGNWSRVDRRTFLRGLGVGGALAVSGITPVLLEACGSTVTTSGTGHAGGHIVEAMPGDIATFNSVLLTDVYSIAASSMIYDPLYMFNPSGAVVPCLAASQPQTSNGGRTYTVKLRTDAKWTDGSPVTTADVALTYNLQFAPKYSVVNAPSRQNFVQYLESIKVVDAHTIEFTTKNTYAPFMASFMTTGIMPNSVYGKMDPSAINDAPENTKPTVTNGAFKNANWVQGQQVTFDRNPDYYRGAPKLDQYVLKVVSNSTNLLSLLQTGSADLGMIDTSQYQAAKGNSSLDVHIENNLEFVYAIPQLDPSKSTLFQDVRVRQALYWALDRQGIVKTIYFGFAKVANGPLPPTLKQYWDPNIKPEYTYNPKKAEQLLEAAGWTAGSGGVREKDGQQFSFPMLVPSSDQVEINMAQAMQQQWAKVGVKMQIQPVDLTTVLVPALTNKNFQMCLLGESINPDPDTSIFWKTNGSGNFGDYSNPAADKLMAEGLSTLGASARRPIYDKLSSQLMQDPPALFLTYPQVLEAVNKRVLNFVPSKAVSRQYYVNKLETTKSN